MKLSSSSRSVCVMVPAPLSLASLFILATAFAGNFQRKIDRATPGGRSARFGAMTAERILNSLLVGGRLIMGL